MKEYLDVLAALGAQNVRYLVTGGVAAVLHGMKTRPVADLDIVIDPDPAEAQRAMQTLLSVGFYSTIPIPVWQIPLVRTMDARGRRVDVNAKYPIPFDELWSSAAELIVEGVAVRAVALRHLIQVKRGRGRDYDRTDVAALLRELGELDRREGRADDARAHYEESVAMLREMNDPLKLAHTVRHLGDVHRHAGRVEPAEACYREALEIYRGNEQTTPLDLANAVRAMAVLQESAGNAAGAAQLWQEAHDLYAAAGVEAGVKESEKRIASAAAGETYSPCGSSDGHGLRSRT
jgi:hypothetical protein